MHVISRYVHSNVDDVVVVAAVAVAVAVVVVVVLVVVVVAAVAAVVVVVVVAVVVVVLVVVVVVLVLVVVVVAVEKYIPKELSCKHAGRRNLNQKVREYIYSFVWRHNVAKNARVSQLGNLARNCQ